MLSAESITDFAQSANLTGLMGLLDVSAACVAACTALSLCVALLIERRPPAVQLLPTCCRRAPEPSSAPRPRHPCPAQFAGSLIPADLLANFNGTAFLPSNAAIENFNAMASGGRGASGIHLCCPSDSRRRLLHAHLTCALAPPSLPCS